MLPFKDPGWRNSFKVLIPFVGPRLAREHPRTQIEVTRSLFLAFVSVWVLLALVLWFIEIETDDPLSNALAAGIVGTVGVIALVGGFAFVPPLDCSSAEALLSSWRNRLFRRLADAEAPALVAFVVAYQAGSIWPYLLAAPFVLVGFVRAAPTTSSFARHVADLQSRPCAHADVLWELFGPTDAPLEPGTPPTPT